MKGIILFHINLHSSTLTTRRQDVSANIILVNTQHPQKKLETSEQVCDFRTAFGSWQSTLKRSFSLDKLAALYNLLHTTVLGSTRGSYLIIFPLDVIPLSSTSISSNCQGNIFNFVVTKIYGRCPVRVGVVQELSTFSYN